MAYGVFNVGDLVEVNPFVESPGFTGRYAVVVCCELDKNRALVRFPEGYVFWFALRQLLLVSSVNTVST